MVITSEHIEFITSGQSTEIGVVRFLVPQEISFLRHFVTKKTLFFKNCQKVDKNLAKDANMQ